MDKCSRRDCSRPAVREVRWEQPVPPPDGPAQLRGADLCELHAAEIEAKQCERDGCSRFAALVIGLDGHDYTTEAPRQDELHLCEPCWDAMRSAPSVTINGLRMVHDGSGRMTALPRNPGRG